MAEIIPAIIPIGIRDLTYKLSQVKGVVKRVQIDIVDGRYAPKASWPFNGNDDAEFRQIKTQEKGLPFWEDFEFEIDLMVKSPELIIDDWINAGAETLIIHSGSTDDLAGIFASAKEKGVHVALALKPSADISLIAPFINDAAFIQVMGNNLIGENGRPLTEEALETIRVVTQTYPDATIGVDIGVNKETIGKLIEAGASRFACGSAIFDALSVKEAIEELKHAGVQ